MSRRALGPVLLALLAGCSSWNTGSPGEEQAERACASTIETLARAAERCGQDYAASYDAFLRVNAAGDCKNVRSIRDEQALRSTCLPFLEKLPCRDLADNLSHPSCADQLQRTKSYLAPASQRPR